MDFGIILSFANPKPWQVPAARLCEALVNQAVLAEELGYDHVWTAEHHGTDEYYPALFPLLAAMAARTKHIRLGTYIVILPLHHPLQVAEQAVTLDALSDGRFDLGVGQGNFVGDFEAFNIPRRERPSRMEEGLAIIKGLWEQETFSFEGKHFKIPSFSLRPRPVQTRPPLWAAATTEKAIERVARYGCHLAGTGAGFEYYKERLRYHGHDPQDRHTGTLRFVHVADKRSYAAFPGRAGEGKIDRGDGM